MLKGRFRTTNCGSESSFTQGPINQEPDIRLNEEKRFQVTFLTVFKKYISIKVHHFLKLNLKNKMSIV
ncbi:hypothetical protein T03_15344 [Trichinella britovi]|uniref:Uncharacterized protein n=2 Tax=Trichinella TaxID=6333 RepID=A0A0V1C9Y6_TRIBR|nr:hypothetical protein T05_5970 [Trichinella murrelli]KRX56172.1 hypothetical protein T09_9895 [Trichinella sp. T9]KRY45954.1 hypothetical protein T03_15344 [Trichinella britovi]KRZ85075.1 hypothetical protein T08_3677 [Trichinella sp. T8]